MRFLVFWSNIKLEKLQKEVNSLIIANNYLRTQNKNMLIMIEEQNTTMKTMDKIIVALQTKVKNIAQKWKMLYKN